MAIASDKHPASLAKYRPERAHPDSVVGKGFISLVTGLMSPMVKYQFQGTENIPQSGGFIAAANHASEFDALTFAEFLLMNGRQPRVLAKRSLFNTPVVGALMKATGMIPVDRGSDKAAASLDAAAQLLKEGECVALFPEGTLTRDPDLWPMEAKTGVARLAIASRAPVIPIGQWGAVNVLGRYSRVLKPFPRKTIKIAVGKPVDLSEFYGKDDDQVALRAATSKVMDAISALVSELRGQPAPMPRFDLHLHPEYKKKQHKYPPVTRP